MTQMAVVMAVAVVVAVAAALIVEDNHSESSKVSVK